MSEVVSWDDDGTPRSARFDDLYRSASGVKLETMQQGLQMVSTVAQGAIAVVIAAWATKRVVAMRRARA